MKRKLTEQQAKVMKDIHDLDEKIETEPDEQKKKEMATRRQIAAIWLNDDLESHGWQKGDMPE